MDVGVPNARSLWKLYRYCYPHHKKLFQRYGLFDEQFKIAGDYDLILRFYKKFPPVYLPDFIVTKMQIGGISASRELF